MSEHPIAAMIQDIEALKKQAADGSICANIDVSVGVDRGAEIILAIIKKHLAGGAWVDVCNPDCEEDCDLFHEETGKCFITFSQCPGLGQGDCPAYLIKEVRTANENPTET